MSKGTRARERDARQKIAAQRAAARRAQARRRLLIAGGSVALVLVVVVSLVMVSTLRAAPAGGAGSPAGTALPAAVTSRISSVPAAALRAVGTGTATPGSVIRAAGPVLTSGGKPEVLYVGAEYCPYCATERWPLAIALSRFGTFTGLHGIHSSATDAYPDEPTLTFYRSAYASRYLTFVPVETTTRNRLVPLQEPTAAQQALIRRYDGPPYVPASDAGTIPFLDLGNRYLVHGAQYDPQVLQGQTWAQVAAALSDPSSPVARGADGAANMITAALCTLTGNQPARACAAPVRTGRGNTRPPRQGRP